MLTFFDNKTYIHKGMRFFVNNRILWIFYLILFFNLYNKNYEDDISKNDISNIKKSTIKYTELISYRDIFLNTKFDKKISTYRLFADDFFETIVYFLYTLPNKYCKKIRYIYFFRFEKYLNLLSFFFLPNFLYKRLDCSYFIIYSKKIVKSKIFIKLKPGFNIFYKYFNKFMVDKTYIFFMKFLCYHNHSYLNDYSTLVEYYGFLINNLFYINFSKFFIIKDSFFFSSCLYENNKRFFLNFYTNKKIDGDYYIQNNFITSYSSIKFINALNLSKYFNLSYFVKIIMIQHFRRTLVSSDIFSFLIFLKTYVKDFKFIFLNLKCPVNEIFLNPKKKVLLDMKSSKKSEVLNLKNLFNINDIVCDIFINFKLNINLLEYMSKYKDHIKSLLLISEDYNFEDDWKKFIKNFSNSLKLISNFYSSDDIHKILIRYYFDCNVIFILKKKMLPLKKKKAQSIQRRRYKKIVSSAKRRFWIF